MILLTSRIASAVERMLSALSLRWSRLCHLHQWTIGLDSNLGPDGKIVNISGDRSAIEMGSNGLVRGEILVFRHAGRIKIGDWFYLGPNSSIWSADEEGIHIGDRVLISHGTHIHDSNSHPIDAKRRFEQTKAVLKTGHPKKNPGIKSAPIKIGDDVWIGFGATILKGASIGDRAVIGAGSIIKSDVPPDTIVPAKSTF